MSILTVEVGTKVGIPRKQLSCTIRTNGGTMKVDTKKD